MSTCDPSEEPSIDTAAALQALSALEYQTGELDEYLARIAESVSRLLGIDWSVVTLAENPGFDRILASSKDIGAAAEKTYALHGTVTAQVIDRGQSLCVADTATAPQHGTLPEGYRAYVGVPLRTSDGRTIGTICSFHAQPRQFSQNHVQITSLFAERAAAAIERFFAFKKLEAFNSRLEELVDERTRQLKETQSQLVERERLAAIGEFASMITHEVRSPLSTIDMALDYLQQGDLPAGAVKRVGLASQESRRLQVLLSEILAFAKPQSLHRHSLDLDALITEALLPLSELAESGRRTIDYRCQADATVALVDRDKFIQVLTNLVSNAFQATSDDQSVAVTLCAEPEPGWIALEVRNPGQIAERDLDRLTEPFFTTRAQGTGLGLAIVKRIIDAHEGRLEISSDPLVGVCVKASFPADVGPLSAEAGDHSAAGPSSR
ncbi:ATP-binding protein [Thiosocius teredinicola]|uniref:ATP-binding protein n=1 Tax=Thiosocius teredinicola TaxID=1973002 RepID=UPI000990BB14